MSVNPLVRVSRGTPPSRHLDEVLKTVAGIEQKITNGDLLKGPLALASPIRIGNLIITVGPNPSDQDALDVMFQNAKTLNPPVVVWTIP